MVPQGPGASLASRGSPEEFKAALADHGLKAFMGHDASAQPGHLSDLMFHETAVAWARKQEGQTLPRRPWEETADDFATRLKRIAAAINETHVGFRRALRSYSLDRAVS